MSECWARPRPALDPAGFYAGFGYDQARIQDPDLGKTPTANHVSLLRASRFRRAPGKFCLYVSKRSLRILLCCCIIYAALQQALAASVRKVIERGEV